MFPGLPTPERQARRAIPVGVLVAWVIGTILIFASTVMLAQTATLKCADTMCEMSAAMTATGAVFGVFFGGTFFLLGIWSLRKAAQRTAREAEQLYRVRADLLND